MKIFAVVLFAASIIGGFVGGELTGRVFSITGGVIGGLAVAAVIMSLGAYFNAQDKRKRKQALPDDVRSVFDRMLKRQTRATSNRVSPPPEAIEQFVQAMARLGCTKSPMELRAIGNPFIARFDSPYIAAMDAHVTMLAALARPGVNGASQMGTSVAHGAATICEFVLEGKVPYETGKQYFDQVMEFMSFGLPKGFGVAGPIMEFDNMLDLHRETARKRRNPPPGGPNEDSEGEMQQKSQASTLLGEILSRARSPELQAKQLRLLQKLSTDTKSQQPSAATNPGEETYLSTALKLLTVQLLPKYTSPKQAFGDLMTNKRAAGYVFGLHDALLQRLGLCDPSNSNRSASLIEHSYKDMFGASAGYALYTRSIASQDDPAFVDGRNEGGNELVTFTEQNVPPFGLGRMLILHSDAGGAAANEYFVHAELPRQTPTATPSPPNKHDSGSRISELDIAIEAHKNYATRCNIPVETRGNGRSLNWNCCASVYASIRLSALKTGQEIHSGIWNTIVRAIIVRMATAEKKGVGMGDPAFTILETEAYGLLRRIDTAVDDAISGKGDFLVQPIMNVLSNVFGTSDAESKKALSTIILVNAETAHKKILPELLADLS